MWLIYSNILILLNFENYYLMLTISPIYNIYFYNKNNFTMENTILDELLSKIKTLETKNTKLFEEIETIKVNLQEDPKRDIDSDNGMKI
jgi:hypothetical protein